VNAELVNVVAGGDLRVTINLHKLSSQLSQYSVSYEPEVSPGLHFELPLSSVTVMIFGSGKYHLTGGEGVDQIFEANEEVIDIIGECVDEEVNAEDPDIRNLVYRGDFEREFDLVELAAALENTEYEPEAQPGIKHRPSDQSGLVTIFRTGRFTITGVKNSTQGDDLICELESKITNLVSD
jgi:transcription initiation factor TFIID TATA-box-binding protein